MKKPTLIITVILISTLSPRLTAGTYAGGSGTPEDPYHIATAQNIYEMSDTPEDWNKCFIVTDEIDLSGIFWTGTPIPDFEGYFDGNGKAITGLNITGNNRTALFGKLYLQATVSNLTLEDVTVNAEGASPSIIAAMVGRNFGTVSNCVITGQIFGDGDCSMVGGVTGWNSVTGEVSKCQVSICIENTFECVGGITGLNKGTVDSCTIGGNIQGSSFVGGIAGYNTGYVGDCTSCAYVQGTEVGGIVGKNSTIPFDIGQPGTISNCHSTGTISGRTAGGVVGWSTYGSVTWCSSTGRVDGFSFLGGLIGYMRNTRIMQCFSSCEVSGKSNLGGFIGHSNGTITECYSTGSVSGNANSSRVGGFVGYNEKSICNSYATGSVTAFEKAGGFAGENSSLIEACYSVGTVEAENLAGGLVGCRDEVWSIPRTSYFLSNAGPDNGLGTPLTREQMKKQSTFARWDFAGETKNGVDDYWWINEDRSFPRLWWQENHGPVADAGVDRVYYAPFEGFAEVALDGSVSSDDDGDALDYHWRWETDGEGFETEGVNPVIQLSSGEHEITLIVSDGIADSEPDTVLVKVIPPVEASLFLVPKVINTHSRGRNIMAMLSLPEGIEIDDIDTDHGFALYPGNIQASLWRSAKENKAVKIFILFNREEVIAAMIDRDNQKVTVAARLKSGPFIFGVETIRKIEHENARKNRVSPNRSRTSPRSVNDRRQPLSGRNANRNRNAGR